jgi:hypothetical protein
LELLSLEVGRGLRREGIEREEGRDGRARRREICIYEIRG